MKQQYILQYYLEVTSLCLKVTAYTGEGIYDSMV